MTLSKQKQQSLKAQAHALKPTVLLGAKGLTPAVLREIDLTLQAHELIKIKLSGVDRDDKQRIIQEICQSVQAELIQLVGHMATLYRENPEQIKQSKSAVRSR